ncbi:MAG: PAS domain-containing protein, partial [Beijerinckiaceae bacterium]
DVFILGRGPDGLWRYRVAGTRLSAYADRDLRGELFTGWWRPHDQIDVARLLAATASERSAIIGGVSALSDRKERHQLELILLPLRHGGQEGLRMMGALVPAPDTARAYGLRFGELAVVSLRSLAAVDVGSEPFGRPRSGIEELVERRHGLRVIEGGRA